MRAARVSTWLNRRSRRWWRGAALVALLLLTVTAVWAQEETPPQAALVVVGEEGVVLTRCVPLQDGPVTGVTLLEQADVAPVFQSSSAGTAICALQGVGCPATDCFCQCKGSPCRYWSYFQRQADGTWAYSGVGAAGRTLNAGDADAWVWGDGSQLPPALTWEELCPAPVTATPESPTPEVTPTAPAAPTYQVFLPGGQSETPLPAVTGPWRFIPSAWRRPLEQYGSFVLLLLALIALVLVRRARPGRKG